MRARVVRWGNSLAIRIPAQLARELGWQEGTPVELTAGPTGLRVTEPGNEVPTLEEMLDRMRPEHLHDLVDWGPPVGKEVW